MEEKVLETTMNEGLVVDTTEMPVTEVPAKGLSTGKKIAIATVVGGVVLGGIFLGRKIYKGIKAKKEVKTEETSEVAETKQEEAK